MATKLKKYIIYHFHFDVIAGTERVLFNILEYLSSNPQNEVVLVLLSEKNTLVFGVEKLPIKIVFLDVPKSTNKLLYFYNVFKKTKSYFKQTYENKEKIILTTNYVLGLILFKTTQKQNTKIVSCEHFTVSATGKFSHIIRKLYYHHINVVMLTQEDANHITQLYNPNKCVAIPNAIPFDIKPFNENDMKTIIAIGRFTHQKGFDLLIRSYALIHKEFPEWKLEIIGDDFGDKQMMKDLILHYQIDTIDLIPASNNIQKFYENASFFVMSSRFEGLPMVLLEAIGYGLPIVSFNCPTGPKEVVDTNNGYLVENGNIQHLAQSMKELMRNRNLLLEKAEGSHRKAFMFTKDKINKQWDDFFKTI